MVSGDANTTVTMEARACISEFPDILKACATINFVPANIVKSIEIKADPVPKDINAGDHVSLRARLVTQDEEPYCGNLLSALSCFLTSAGAGQKSTRLQAHVEHDAQAQLDICLHNMFRSECTYGCKECPARPQPPPPPDEQGNEAWVRWVVDPTRVQKAGKYTLTVRFEENRPELKSLPAHMLPSVGEQRIEFTVIPGSVWHIGLGDGVGTTNHVVSNSSDPNSTGTYGNVILEKLTLQTMDAFRNPFASTPCELKVAAFLARPRPRARSVPVREICAEVEFSFVNDSERQEQMRSCLTSKHKLDEEIKELQEELERIDKTTEKQRKNMEAAMEQLMKDARHADSLSSLPGDLSLSELESQYKTQQASISRHEACISRLTKHIDLMKLRPGGRALEVPKDIENEVARFQALFSSKKVLGCLGQLIQVRIYACACDISRVCAYLT